MRVLTWNIQWGRGMDGRVDLARVVDYVRARDPDVVCLQEVTDNMPDLDGCDGADQFAALAALLPDYAAVDGAGLVSFDASGRRRFGNMIFSRFPVAQTRLHSLPWPAEGRQHLPRALVEAMVVTPSGPVRIMTTHLEYWSGPARAAQVEAIRRVYAEGAARAARPPEPTKGPYAPLPHAIATVLTGDFNMKPDDPAFRPLGRSDDEIPPLLDVWRVRNGETPHPPSFCITDQTYGAPHCCDIVFVSEDLAGRITDVAYDVSTRLSDHQPVLVTFG